MEIRVEKIRMKDNCSGKEEKAGISIHVLYTHARAHMNTHTAFHSHSNWYVTICVRYNATTHVYMLWCCICNTHQTHTCSTFDYAMHILHKDHWLMSLQWHAAYLGWHVLLTHTHGERLLSSVPSRQTSTKIKPQWSKNTSQGTWTKDRTEEATNAERGREGANGG